MKKTIIIIAVLVVVGIGAYYFTVNNNSGVPTYTPTPTIQPSATPTSTPKTSVSNTPKTTVAGSVTVDIINFSFNPSAITVKIGTKVTWTNNDSVSHTVTSDSGSFINSQTLSPGQSFSFTFTNAGTVSYHCSIHPMMKGSVVVTN